MLTIFLVSLNERMRFVAELSSWSHHFFFSIFISICFHEGRIVSPCVSLNQNVNFAVIFQSHDVTDEMKKILNSFLFPCRSLEPNLYFQILLYHLNLYPVIYWFSNYPP